MVIHEAKFQILPQINYLNQLVKELNQLSCLVLVPRLSTLCKRKFAR